MKLKLLLFGLVIAGLFLISACANSDVKKLDELPVIAPPDISTIANPASEYCVQIGGTSEIRTLDDGSQVGYCQINSIECEEWSLFRGECDKVHICTDEEKLAQICTMEFMPVCGSNGVEYGNKCSACADKVSFLTLGECPK